MQIPSSALARTVTAAVVLTSILAACGAGATPVPSQTSSPGPTAAASGTIEPSAPVRASASPQPSTASVEPEQSPPAPSPSIGRTDTVWGRIWDAVPASFPAYPGSTTTEIGHASSDERIVAGAADEVATWYQEALETAGYSTEAMSGPFEDGSLVIDSVGDPLECRVQVSVRPVAELIVIDILYGADCPST